MFEQDPAGNGRLHSDIGSSSMTLFVRKASRPSRARRSSPCVPCRSCRLFIPPLPRLAQSCALLFLAARLHAAPLPLDTITVTGAREPVPLGDVLQDVTVIDRATIDAHAGQSIESLLAEQAGIQVSTDGGIGAVSSVFVRGANSDSTLLLIDGMRYGSASAGTPIFYNLPLDQIDHIEIVRGPMSSVYGADAAGGVIQVFTRRGVAGFQAGGSATLGSESYRAVDGGVRGGGDALDYAFSAGTRRTDGYPYTNAHVPFGLYNPNDDGFTQTSGSANLGYALAPGWSVRLQGLDARGDVQFADGFDPARPGLTARSRVGTSAGSIVVQGKLAAAWSTTLRYGASRDDYDTDVAVYSYDLGRYTTNQQTVSWQNDVLTPLGTVLAAVEQLRQGVSSDVTAFTVDHRTVDGLQLGLNGRAGPHAWQANVRSDQNSQFGHQSSGAASYGFDLTGQWRLGASAGTSFVMPSFDDLYYPGYSNPLLRPQHGRSVELNARWRTPGQQLRVALYQNRFRDLIALDTNFLPVNIAQSRIRGASLEYKASLGALSLGSTIDTMVPLDLTDGTVLPHRARDTLSVTADWAFTPAWSAGGVLRSAGPRYDDTANLQTLGGYGLLTLHGSWKVDRDWSLALSGNNLTGHAVEPAYGYDAPPRQWFFTVRYGAL